MFPSLSQVVHLRDWLHEQNQFRHFPKREDLGVCLDRAYDIAGKAPRPAIEAAALFFAFSIEAHLVGDGRIEMPSILATDQLMANGLDLSEDDLDRLADLQLRVEEVGEDSWGYVRDWFLEHAHAA